MEFQWLINIALWLCQSLDSLVDLLFGRFMPTFLASFSFSLLISTIAAYLDRKNHYLIKYLMFAFYAIYSMYKIYVWQIADELGTINTIFAVFLFLIYPFGLLFVAAYFKSWKIGPFHIFNYHFFWIVYFCMIWYFAGNDPLAISVEFCLIYAVASYTAVYVFGGSNKNGC